MAKIIFYLAGKKQNKLADGLDLTMDGKKVLLTGDVLEYEEDDNSDINPEAIYRRIEELCNDEDENLWFPVVGYKGILYVAEGVYATTDGEKTTFHRDIETGQPLSSVVHKREN